MRRLSLSILVFIGLFVIIGNYSSVGAFQYSNNLLTNSEFNSQNLIKNPWFRSSNCTFSGDKWNLNDTAAGSQAAWDMSDKEQDPADPGQPNCNGSWWGYAARFAKGSGGVPFSSGKNAIMSQVVGIAPNPPINPNDKTLHFHALIVAHRVNEYKAEIYGGNTQNGPWNLVWTPFNIQACLAEDCVNATYGPGCNQGNRQCLWDDVTSDPHVLGSLDAVQKTIPTGYPFYKIQFSMRYPTEDLSLSTGDVGGKLARVFFKVSGTGGGPTITPTPTPSAPTLKQLILAWLTANFDQNGDGIVNSIDFAMLLP